MYPIPMTAHSAYIPTLEGDEAEEFIRKADENVRLMKQRRCKNFYMNTTITIRNEHGDFSVSAPTHESIDEMIDLFALALRVASWREETINQAFLEKAAEIDSEE